MADTGGRERRSVALARRQAGTRGAAGRYSHRGRPVLAARPEGVSAPGPGGGLRGPPAAGGREILATAEGITVYPPRAEGERWRAVWYEPDGRRGRCQAVTEGRLTAKLEPVAERLAAQAPNTSALAVS